MVVYDVGKGTAHVEEMKVVRIQYRCGLYYIV